MRLRRGTYVFLAFRACFGVVADRFASTAASKPDAPTRTDSEVPRRADDAAKYVRTPVTLLGSTANE
jgi:hypothetical protein